ncbi:hypothetical protein B0T16DRAFT_189981 [Cercophora newfieldiana]|uniref:F-box domain-containing protein n=1 Tax=Cercophora newfieldiana TaxID=92897 RepID=A0AA40CME1_9PEZI|nr:hypothetical protein B0T16DRAFT_189981 [Cercophora newfieldiana]
MTLSTTPFPLLHLAAELILCICDFLDPGERGKLRLACKDLNAIIRQFAPHQLMIFRTEKDITYLRETASSERLARNVREVVYLPDSLDITVKTGDDFAKLCKPRSEVRFGITDSWHQWYYSEEQLARIRREWKFETLRLHPDQPPNFLVRTTSEPSESRSDWRADARGSRGSSRSVSTTSTGTTPNCTVPRRQTGSTRIPDETSKLARLGDTV